MFSARILPALLAFCCSTVRHSETRGVLLKKIGKKKKSDKCSNKISNHLYINQERRYDWS